MAETISRGRIWSADHAMTLYLGIIGLAPRRFQDYKSEIDHRTRRYRCGVEANDRHAGPIHDRCLAAVYHGNLQFTMEESCHGMMLSPKAGIYSSPNLSFFETEECCFQSGSA
jgi:hypothetical protein